MKNALRFLFSIALISFATLGSARQSNADDEFAVQHPPDILAPTVGINSQSLLLNGKPFFIMSGALHYFRVPKELWADRLEKMRAAGLNTVETYVAWNWHEPAEGVADYKDLDDFISLTQQMGFFLIVRPGPYICAEWEAGGYPLWVTSKVSTLRSGEASHLKVVEGYFNRVLPVIKKHLYTKGGNVILVQIENEYDFNGPMVPDNSRMKLLKKLYELTQSNGIDVPIITCWTREARNQSTPFGRKVTDAVNFYPSGNFKSVVNELTKLRVQQPDEPMWITELEGGWFSEVGGILSTERTGVDAAEIGSLTKLVISQGVTGYSYYMFFGGTNFGYWGAEGKTTTYDYYAPLAEPGGLHDKFYEVKAVTDFLHNFGGLLAVTADDSKSLSIKDDYTGDAGEVMMSMRRAPSGESFLFFENRKAKTASFRAVVKAPGGDIVFPSRPLLKIASMEAKMLPMNVDLGNGNKLVYTTSEISGITELGMRKWIVLYDHASYNGEIRLEVNDVAIAVGGAAAYVDCDAAKKQITIGFKTEPADQTITVGDKLVIVVSDRGRGLHTWWAGSFRRDISTPLFPIISDAYLMREGKIKLSINEFNVSADMELRPGVSHFSVPLISDSKLAVLVDGKEIKTKQTGRLANFRVSLPAADFTPGKIKIDSLEAKPMNIANTWGKGKPMDALAPLEKIGYLTPGFYFYSAEIPAHAAGSVLTVETYSEDITRVFVNGKMLIPQELNRPGTILNFNLDPDTNTSKLIVFYEKGDRPNGGPGMSERKGIWKVTLKDAAGVKQEITKFTLLQSTGLDENNAASSTTSDKESIKKKALGDWKNLGGELSGYDGIVWYTARFNLPAKPAADVPLGLRISASDYALIYLNGKLLARYWDKGPQSFFYLPEPWLTRSGENTVQVAVVNSGFAGGLFALGVAPYSEFAAKPVRIEINYKK